MLRAAGSRLIAVILLSSCADDQTVFESGFEWLQLEEVARIGSNGDSTFFGEIGNVTVNDAGQILVEDRGALDVTVFSPDGDFISRFGRPGRAPGEFESMSGIAVGPGDSVYVFDPVRGQISVFDPDWRFAYGVAVERRKSGRLSLSGLFSAVVPQKLIGVTLAGFVIRYESLLLPLPGLIDQPRDTDASAVLVVWDGNSQRSPVAKLPGREFIHATSGEELVVMLRPFGRNSHFRMDHSGVVYAGWNETIDIEKRRVDGRLIGRIRHDHAVVAVTLADIAVEMEEMGRDARRLVQESDLPSTLAAYETFIVDSKGNAWLQEDLTRVAPDSLATWTIIDPGSQLTAKTRLPARETLQVVRSNTAYGNGREADGTPIVLIYEVDE